MSWRRLYEYRSFYVSYPQLYIEILNYLQSQSTQVITGQANILRSLPAIFQNGENQTDAIKQPQKSSSLEPWQTSPSKLFHCINYTSLQMLSEIQDPLKRAFYEHELIQGCWSTRQLDRQISTLYYERSALSRDKEALKQHMLSSTHESMQPHHYLRDPLTLEFLGIPETEFYTETKLESAILDNLQSFLMDYRHEVMQPGDNPPIGLLLCTDYSDTLVQYSTEGLSDIYVGKYMLHLPSTETIRQYLIDHMPKQSEEETERNQQSVIKNLRSLMNSSEK